MISERRYRTKNSHSTAKKQTWKIDRGKGFEGNGYERT